MISKRTIECIQNLKIEDVIGDYVELKKKGKNYIGICPFHTDSTPSLTVFPITNTYKCFACGAQGDGIKFVMEHECMTFAEALKTLAKNKGIEIEEEELSPEEQEKYHKKEALRIGNDFIAKEYARQLLLPENKEARNYAYSRWGEEFCNLMGIGYCPPYSKLISTLGLSEEVIKGLKAVSESGYDFFCGRIVIPIRDKSQYVIGFTARQFGQNEKGPKYINTSDTLLYSKSHSIFGMNFAWKAARKNDVMYLVEGAPDCMRLHSLGVWNAVAPLGTAWTDNHFEMLRNTASHLCFLPDADPPKEGEHYGPGINAVMSSGEAAIKYGFSVSVKQIPVTEEKQDPDTYCTTIERFNEIPEQDFVLWLAELIFHKDMTTTERSTAMKRIAGILACEEDESVQEMYISSLIKFGVTKRMWKMAIEKYLKDTADEATIKKREEESNLYNEYGFSVKNNKYYSIGDKGYYEWSNFIMEPLFHIKDAVMPKRLYLLHNVAGVTEIVELKQEDLVSLSKFKQKVEGLGNFVWKASERELVKLKAFLYEKTATAIPITQLGWQRFGFFAFGNGIVHENKFLKVDDYGIVTHPKGNFYLPANSKIYRDDSRLFQFERKFVHLDLCTITLQDFSDQIFLVFGNNGKVGFLFFLATLFRDIVVRYTRSFPILNLFGPKGSGKSELGHTLMSFFEIDNIPPNIQNSTLPALNDTVAAVANALVHIDEYKNGLDINKHEFLKGLWDGTGRTRMNMDLDKKKETTSVDSGVILSGQEMPTADIALFSRLIFLSFDKSEFTEEQKRNYMKLRSMRSQGMTHLTIQLLKYRNVVEDNFLDFYHKTMKDINEELKNYMIEDRILLNWLAPLAVYRCLETHIGVSLSYKEMFHLFTDGISRQNSECKQNNELAAFWNMVGFLVNDGDLIEGSDYRIEHVTRLKTDMTEQVWQTVHTILYVQKTRIFMLYKKNGKAVGETLLPEGSLKYYLEHSREYLGEKNGIRYKLFRKGIPVMEQQTAKGGPLKEKSTVQRSYCFDYEALMHTYGINIECATDADGDTAHKEDIDASRRTQDLFPDDVEKA